LTAIADEPRAIYEVSETNNRYVEGFVAARTDDDQGPLGQVPGVASNSTGSEASTAPIPVIPAATPSTPDVRVTTTRADVPRPDLTVGAIRVNGQEPEGKGDCKDGKNAVAVVVTNGGPADAESFVVRLVVDDAQGDAVEQSVSGLGAGKEREVRFGEVRLKKGEHRLAVTLDPKHTLAESDAGNNTGAVTATCRDDG
jgi:hypothetical protein